MSAYLPVIRQAFLFFPVLAALFTLPYLLWNYHRYGAVLSVKAVVIYGLLLYLLTVFFLVSFPLPSRASVAASPDVSPQLHLLAFVHDIERDQRLFGQSGLLSLVHNRAFLQFAFNVVMTIPFGLFLRWYCGCGLLKTMLFSFLLSLFLEVSQLTGLFFLYPKAYRVFDVDDLLANTLGGLAGALLIWPFLGILPSRQALDESVYRRGQTVSLLRRLVAAGLDGVSCLLISFLLVLFWPGSLSFWKTLVLCGFGWMTFWPLVLKARTPGMWSVQVYVARADGQPAGWGRVLLRDLLVLCGYALLPGALLVLILHLPGLAEWRALLLLCLASGYGLFLLEQMIRFLLHRPVYFASWSQTRLCSSVRIPEQDDPENIRKSTQEQPGPAHSE